MALEMVKKLWEYFWKDLHAFLNAELTGLQLFCVAASLP